MSGWSKRWAEAGSDTPESAADGRNSDAAKFQRRQQPNPRSRFGVAEFQRLPDNDQRSAIAAKFQRRQQPNPRSRFGVAVFQRLPDNDQRSAIGVGSRFGLRLLASLAALDRIGL